VTGEITTGSIGWAQQPQVTHVGGQFVSPPRVCSTALQRS
jgi:hypothetical protein